MSWIKGCSDAYVDAQSFIDATKYRRCRASDFIINTDASVDTSIDTSIDLSADKQDATTKVKEYDTKANKDLLMLI